MRTLILVALATAAGCAAQPEVSGTKNPDAPASASAATLAAPAEVAVAAGEKSAQFEPPKGYRMRTEGGNTFYCTKVVVLGSRFAKEDCRTQAELEDLVLQRASMRGEIEQRRRICGSAAACANP